MTLHTGLRKPRRYPLALLAVILLCLSTGRSDGQEKNGKEKTGGVQPLTLETLYHPEQKVDFDGDLPKTHWISDPAASLLIKREKGWMRVDRDSRSEESWPVVGKLIAKLKSLDGVTDEDVEAATDRIVAQMKTPSDAALVRLGKSLAMVSLESDAKWLTRDGSTWNDATLDPTHGRLAYTRDGDLYVIEVASGRQVQLTNDGSETLLDGRLDWTYQEEIYGRGNFKGFWFSPDGQWLAMLQIDISGIPAYTLGDSESERGVGLVSRYPKAGDPIPHASLLVWDLRRIGEGEVPSPRVLYQSTSQAERVITGVWWNPQQPGLLFAASDRTQTWRELRRIDGQALRDGSAESTLVLREESPAWVEPPVEPGWLDDGGLVWRSELPTGRMRLYRISASGQSVAPLTPANFDVRDFQLSEDSDFILLTGDLVRGTQGQQIYRVELDGGSGLQPLTDKPGWHAPKFSPDASGLTDVYSTAAAPARMSLHSSTAGGDSSEPPYVLADSKLQLEGELIAPRFLKIKAEDGFELPAMLIKPKTSSTSGLPVVIEVYGGPRAPKVVDRWSGTTSLYRQLLARRGIATLVLDNRSSAGNGLADTWVIRGRVGEIEVKDLLSGTAWLRGQPWVASDRLAVRGWSFGGFMTLYAMTHSDAFRAGIAGGSVTDWREYDAFYTERYMGLPSENEEGYQITAPVRHAAELNGTVLMIHGEADDNVHPCGTLRMAKALQEAGKDFQLMVYPGAAHSVREPRQLWHLSQMTDRFLRNQLLGAD